MIGKNFFSAVAVVARVQQNRVSKRNCALWVLMQNDNTCPDVLVKDLPEADFGHPYRISANEISVVESSAASNDSSAENSALAPVRKQESQESGSSLVSLNLNRLWERCLQRVRPLVEAHIFNAYLAPLKFVSFDAGSQTCFILAPSKFVSNYVNLHLKSSIENLVASVFSSALNCQLASVSLNIELAAASGARSEQVWLARGTAAVIASEPGVATQRSQQPNGTPSIIKGAEFNAAGASTGSISSMPIRSIPARSMPGIASTRPGSQSFASFSPSLSQPSFSSATAAAVSSSFSSSSSSSSSNANHRSFLSQRYRFDNFVVGNNSEFVHAAALQISEQPGQKYNPFFIYGGVGLGKTHLLHAIGNALLTNFNPHARVLYLSSETFTNELIQALRIGKMDEFKTRLRTIDLLLIDDIQFISGKERTQEEFFHTFNALYSARKQIVMTADKMPQDMPGIEERLQTRFTWGLAADLQAPDFETRVAIVIKKCAADGIELPQEIAHFIAERVSSNVRELEGALTRLQAYSSLQKKPVDLGMAELALKPFTQKRAVTLSSEDIKRAVALHFGVRTSEMVSKTRTKSVSFPRHVAMFLCRKHTTLSYPEIGGEFGGRDHSSVIHAANVVAGKVQSDQEIRKIVQDIETRLMAGG